MLRITVLVVCRKAVMYLKARRTRRQISWAFGALLSTHSYTEVVLASTYSYSTQSASTQIWGHPLGLFLPDRFWEPEKPHSESQLKTSLPVSAMKLETGSVFFSPPMALLWDFSEAMHSLPRTPEMRQGQNWGDSSLQWWPQVSSGSWLPLQKGVLCFFF